MDASFYRLKAATRDLVKIAGGVDRAGETAGYSKSEVSRWQSASESAVIPLLAVLRLEAECGVAPVTAVMAEAGGRRLVDGSGEAGRAGSLVQHHAEVVKTMATVMSVTAEALADGEVSRGEAERIDRASGEHEAALRVFRDDLAEARVPRLAAVR